MPTVLIVEDDPPSRAGLAAALADLGHDVLTAADGAAALAVLARRDVDLVVSDLMMEGVDGLALLRAMKRDAPGVPFILVTAFTGAPAAQQALAEGALGCVPKPIDLTVLETLVSRALP